MNLNKIIKREILITAATVIAIAITFLGLTYAIYFVIDEKNIGTVTFGQLTFDMCADQSCSTGGTTYGTRITGSVYPMNTTEGVSQTPYLFKLSNNGSYAMGVKVYVARNNEVENYQNVVIASRVQGTSTYSYTNLTSVDTAVVLDTTLSIGQNKVIELYMWVDEEAENDLMGKSISLFVNAIGYYKPSDPNNLHTTDSYVANVVGPETSGKLFSYTGDYQVFEAKMSGYYYIQAYGAQGGSAKYTIQYYGGKGAYTSGYLYLTEGEKIYIYVGGMGISHSGTTTDTQTNNGNGYNGGVGGAFTASNSNAGGGGGATDIRYFGNSVPSSSDLQWDSLLGLNSRIMVAAGGGGAASHKSAPSYSGHGGAGGTLIGQTAQYENLTCYNYGEGGFQTVGGRTIACSSSYTTSASGAFGVGGNKRAGGGGGYYGGGGGQHSSGGGGSSFISGYAGVDAITSSSVRTATNNTLHYSGKYFLNASMKENENLNNGSVIVTYKGLIPRENQNLDNVRYIKDCINGNTVDDINSWYEIQAIKDGVNIAKNKTVTGTVSQYNSTYNYNLAVNGIVSEDYYARASGTGLACLTVDLGSTYDLDEIAVWHNTDNRVFEDAVTSVSSDNSTWVDVITIDTFETPNGKRTIPYYRKVEYLVTYDCNGGYGSNDFVVAGQNETINIAGLNCGYRITEGTSGSVEYQIGWSETPNGSTISELMVTESTTLYAIYNNLFSYDGTYNVINDDNENWRVKFLTSGVLSLTRPLAADIFAVGGGGSGSKGSDTYSGKAGGGGGRTSTVLNQSLADNYGYTVTIGAGGICRSSSNGTGRDGSASSFSSLITAAGGNGAASYSTGGAGGSGGAGRADSKGLLSAVGGADGSDGENGNGTGGAGQGHTTREFGEATGDLYAGGGGGMYNSANTYPGGGGGGGHAGSTDSDGTPNTGGGGGGGCGAGGSGIVIIRNHRS